MDLLERARTLAACPLFEGLAPAVIIRLAERARTCELERASALEEIHLLLREDLLLVREHLIQLLLVRLDPALVRDDLGERLLVRQDRLLVRLDRLLPGQDRLLVRQDRLDDGSAFLIMVMLVSVMIVIVVVVVVIVLLPRTRGLLVRHGGHGTVVVGCQSRWMHLYGCWGAAFSWSAALARALSAPCTKPRTSTTSSASRSSSSTSSTPTRCTGSSRSFAAPPKTRNPTSSARRSC